MSKHYQSPESIRVMPQGKRIGILQDIIFEHKQKLPQGDFKTGQDILKALFHEEERRRFENECLLYDVCFVLLVQEVEVRDAGSGDCSGDLDACCGITSVSTMPQTEKISLRLHPLLVTFLNDHCSFINQYYPSNGSSVYNSTLLSGFLQEKGRNELQEQLDAQYRDVICQTTFHLQGRTRVLHSRGCIETELGQETTVLELEHKVILHQIRLQSLTPI